MELVLGILMASSFTCVGLLALWAATAPRHWFLRAAVVLAVLSTLLLIPAYEPFIVFVLQTCVVVLGVRLFKRQGRSGESLQSSELVGQVNRQSLLRFTLPTLLWLMALVAIAVTITSHIATRLGPQSSQGWATVILQGVFSGGAVLLGAWTVAARRKRAATIVGFALCLVMAAILSWQDWFVTSILPVFWWPSNASQWPTSAWEAEVAMRMRTAAVWFGTVIGICFATTAAAMLWTAGWAVSSSGHCAPVRNDGNRRQIIARLGFVTVLLLTAALPVTVFVQLLNPSPIPQVTLPDPNGYDDLVAAGKMIEDGSPMLNTAVEPKSTEELAAEVAKFAPAYERIRRGISRPCLTHTWTNADGSATDLQSIPLSDIQSLRAAGRALMREAELAQRQRRFRDAANISVENLRLGQAATRGGLLVDYLVGIAIEGIGRSTLYPAIVHLDADSCSEVRDALDAANESREPLADILVRDRIWSENAHGWSGHLIEILDGLGDGYGTQQMVDELVFPKEQSLHRLLVTELAVRQYQLEHGNLPERLNELVPQHLALVPMDPFDPNGGPLKYSRTPDGFLLYSFGADHDDDGGRAPVRDEFGGMDFYGDGDLRLDEYFAPELAPVEEVGPVDEASAGEE